MEPGITRQGLERTTKGWVEQAFSQDPDLAEANLVQVLGVPLFVWSNLTMAQLWRLHHAFNPKAP